MSGRFSPTPGRPPLATPTQDGLLSAAHYRKLASWPVVRLAYEASTDLLNGAALTGGSWNNVNSDQAFDVSGSAAHLAVFIRAGVLVTSASIINAALRAVIDGSVVVPLQAGWAAAGAFVKMGGAAFRTSGLSAGTHQIRVQVITSSNGTAYCRASAAPDYEFLEIDIYELSP